MTVRRDGRISAVRFCRCGCGSALPIRPRFHTGGRQRLFASIQHQARFNAARRAREGFYDVKDDLEDAEIERRYALALRRIRCSA